MTGVNFLAKYEPQTPGELIWPSDKAKAAILDYLPSPGDGFGKLHPLLLYGNYGGGKSTIMKRLPYWIDPSFQVPNRKWLVADARKNISEMVHIIKRFTEFEPYGGGMKALLIDEADNLDSKIQQGLKGQITEIVGQNTDVLIVLATNHIDQVDGGIVSRCVTVDMSQRDPERYLPKMREILTAENVGVMTDRALLTIAEAAGSDIRELYRMMEQLVDALRAQQGPPNPPPVAGPPRSRGSGLTLLKQPVT